MKLFRGHGHVPPGDSLESAEAMADDLEVGDATAAVRQLYVHHAASLRAALRHLVGPAADADDLLQEVFIVALKRPKALLSAPSPRAWLFGVAVKVSAAARRRSRLRAFFGLGSVPEPVAPGSLESRVESTQLVWHALAGMSDAKREVLVLFEMQGLSGPEVAEALGCPLKTVWSRLHYARRELEKVVRSD